MKRVVVLGGLLVLTAAACTSTPQHDVVVGEIARCQVYGIVSQQTGSATRGWIAKSGDDCSAQGALSVYVELTIRTPKGTTYTTKIPTNRKVQIGDPWPE